MNNVKRKNKIYYLLDLFFIFAPILLLVGLFVINFFSFNGLSFTDISPFDFYEDSILITPGYSSFIRLIRDSFMSSLEYFNNFWWNNFLDFGENSGFVGMIYTFIRGLFLSVFGLAESGDYLVWDFINGYFSYVVMYEFLSLFINIVLWIPRYIRSWVQEKGVNV